MNKMRNIFITIFFILAFLSLASADETLTITTYYPSPYGSYNQLTTTGNTYLATTSGNVGIGTTNATAGTLQINNGTGTSGLYVGTNVSRTTPNIRSIGYSSDNVNAGGGIELGDGATNSVIMYIFRKNTNDFVINTTGLSTNDLYISPKRNLLLNSPGGSVGIGTTNPSYTLDVTGTGRVTGAFTKGSGTFDIPHPDPAKKKDGWRLRHSFVESPTRGDNIYRWGVNVVNKTALITLPDYFKYLNENVQVWVSPDKHFGRGFGEVDAELTKITITAESDGPYNVLAIGTRKDKVAREGFDPLGLEYQEKKK